MRSCVSTNGKTAARARHERGVADTSAKTSYQGRTSSHTKPTSRGAGTNHSRHKLNGLLHLPIMLGLVAVSSKAGQLLSDPQHHVEVKAPFQMSFLLPNLGPVSYSLTGPSR